MQMHRNIITRTLNITDNYLTVLSYKSGIDIKNKKFITFEQLESICDYLGIKSGDYRTMALKNRIINFMKIQRLNND